MARTPTRPGSLTFVAIVLMILGGLSVLGGLMGAPQMIFTAVTPDPGPRPQGQPGGGPDLIRLYAKECPSYYPVMGALMFFDLMFGIAQIVCGAGIFKMNPARRIPAILVTLGKMLFSFANHAYQLIVLGPVTTSFFQANIVMPPGPQGQPPPPMPFDIGALMHAMMAIVMGITIVVQLAILLTITLILTSATAKAAFAAAAAPPPPPEEDEERRPRRRSRYEGYEGYDDDGDPPPPSSPRTPPETGVTDRSPKPPPETGISDRS